jgi:3-dehydroquinate synthase
MPSFTVETPQHRYECVVQRGVIGQVDRYLPTKVGRVFVVTTKDVWDLHGQQLAASLVDRSYSVLYFPGGEQNKRLAAVEELAEQMVAAGGDRSSWVIGFGGGIVTDLAGFLAASFMRGVPIIQVPTTLLAQVDAGLGGKTGVNLVNGKNLFGAFHQPHAVLVDPEVLSSLPAREYRAGLYEVIKHGVIRDARLFEVLEQEPDRVLALDQELLEQHVLADSIRIKAEVVSQDEREGDLRRILNFGHTFGHALEAETKYERLLHGEAVAFGMRAATHLSELLGLLPNKDAARIVELIRRYGPIPNIEDLSVDNLVSRLKQDKKTIQGMVHFVLADKIGSVRIVKDADPVLVQRAIQQAILG